MQSRKFHRSFLFQISCARFNRIIFVLSAVVFCVPLSGFDSQTPDRCAAVVDSLLSAMTLEEKVGQLHQYYGGRSKNPNSLIDAEQLTQIHAGKIGSYLHVRGAEFLRELQRTAVEESRLGIPLLFALDVVHGYKTIFPMPLACASTWSPETVEQCARIAAIEATAAGPNWACPVCSLIWPAGSLKPAHRLWLS